jgi:hypothetical protein
MFPATQPAKDNRKLLILCYLYEDVRRFAISRCYCGGNPVTFCGRERVLLTITDASLEGEKCSVNNDHFRRAGHAPTSRRAGRGGRIIRRKQWKNKIIRIRHRD